MSKHYLNYLEKIQRRSKIQRKARMSTERKALYYFILYLLFIVGLSHLFILRYGITHNERDMLIQGIVLLPMGIFAIIYSIREAIDFYRIPQTK